jgi:hypothetical protein
VREVPKSQERPATPPAQERGRSQENRSQEKKDKTPE